MLHGPRAPRPPPHVLRQQRLVRALAAPAAQRLEHNAKGVIAVSSAEDDILLPVGRQ